MMELSRENAEIRDIWNAHPAINGELQPCRHRETGEPNFESQCAIRLSCAIQRAGYSMKDYNRAQCWKWICDTTEVHALRCEELKIWLEDKLGEPDVKYHPDWEEYKGKEGIVIFLNFHGKGLQGDHADIVLNDNQTNGSNDYYKRSEKVLFWELD